MARGKRIKDQGADLFERPLKAGDDVLLGSTNACMPGYWYHGKIAWIKGEHIMFERWTQNGETYYQQGSIYEVRAVGTIAELFAIKEQARKEVVSLVAAVSKAETALSQARAAVQNKLEELHKGGLKAVPWDETANEEHRLDDRRIQEEIETHDAATEAA